MPTFLNQQISPPEFWQEFEKLCADLFSRVWNDPDVQLNGRGGQAQHGVDIYGQRDGSNDWLGVQCKGKDGRYGHAVTEKELRDEVEKAKTFTPPLKEFTLATTAENDENLQQIAREITEAHAKNGLFSVTVLSWSEIQRRLPDHPDIIDKHYPDQGPTLHAIKDSLSEISESQTKDEQLHRQTTKDTVKEVAALLTSAGILPGTEDESQRTIDKNIHAEIDKYRDLLLQNKPKTAIGLLEKLKEESWPKVGIWTKFRILTNIGAAHLSVGHEIEASEHFLDAEQYAPENQTAACNVALAHHLLGDHTGARAAAKKAIEAHPHAEAAYSTLIIASLDDLDVDKPENLVPADLQKSGQIAFAISQFYRKRDDQQNAAKWMSEAYAQDSQATEIKCGYAAILLEQILEDQTFSIGEQNVADLKDKLVTATEILSNYWDEIKNSEIAAQQLDTAQNLITAARLGRDYRKAIEVADDALRLSPNSLTFIRHKAIACLQNDDAESTHELLYPLSEEDRKDTAVIHAEALAHLQKFPEALELLNWYLKHGDNPDEILVAVGMRPHMIKEVSGTDAALEATAEAAANHPKGILVLANAASLASDCGDQDSAEKYFRSIDLLLTPETPYRDRLVAANTAFRIKLFDESATLHKELIHSYTDSPTLRNLLISLLESDRRKELLNTLEKIPHEVRELGFFRRIAVAAYVRSGKIPEAFEEMDAYLASQPDDLNVRLIWLQSLFRHDREDDVKAFLSKVGDYPDAPPVDRMRLAHYLDRFGFREKALDIAYTVLHDDPLNAEVHLGYLGLFFLAGETSNLENPKTIDLDTAFSIHDENGTTKSYFISNAPRNEIDSNAIPPNHPISISALGKHAGDRITVQINPLQSREFLILDIHSKYVNALRRSTENFQDRFPENKTFMPVSLVKPGEQELSFDPVFQSISDRQEQVLETLDLYKSHPYPIGIIARQLGVHPIDVWRSFQSDQRVQIFCCSGNQPERDEVQNILENNKSGIIIDPLTLYNIFSLGMHDKILQVAGNIGLTQSSLDLLQSFIEERRQAEQGGGHSFMSKVGDQYTWREVTTEEIKNDIELLQELREWAQKNCEILPAVGRTDIPDQVRQLSELMDAAFIDTILAADGSERLLFSDDQRLRLIGKQFWNLDGVWTQILLIKAWKTSCLSFDEYCNAIATLIESGVYFTTFDISVLMKISESEGWEATDRFKAVLSTLEGERADLESALRISTEFLTNIWTSDIPSWRSTQLTNWLLSAITKNRGEITPNLLRTLAKISAVMRPKKRKDFISSIKGWADGHFIPFP